MWERNADVTGVVVLHRCFICGCKALVLGFKFLTTSSKLRILGLQGDAFMLEISKRPHECCLDERIV
jgi:hypothetical protein